MRRNVRLVLVKAAGPLLVKAAVLSRMDGRGRAVVVLNLALVYLLLTAVLGVVYFGIIGVGGRLGSWSGPAAALAAGALFHPARLRLRELVNRLINVELDPYRLADRVSRSMREADGPVEALASAVTATRLTLGADGVAVEVVLPGGRVRSVADGEPGPDLSVVRLEWQGRSLGRLLVSGEPRDPALLGMLARQLAEVAHAVRLSADLRRSRERMLVTREEERHRLRRNLHDHLGPTLTSLALSMDEARRSLTGDPGAAADGVRRRDRPARAAPPGRRAHARPRRGGRRHLRDRAARRGRHGGGGPPAGVTATARGRHAEAQAPA
ncbi:histidine kinase [Nonomuraea sp. NPDC050643]|uniref:histidine kinase n=1 Tax=Nonomuraea sp. NPDC050643 TaxID=3155660 RepID=UPI0033E1DAA7